MNAPRSRIETYEDVQQGQYVYTVRLPYGWIARQRDRVVLTWKMLQLIWGVGAKLS